MNIFKKIFSRKIILRKDQYAIMIDNALEYYNNELNISDLYYYYNFQNFITIRDMRIKQFLYEFSKIKKINRKFYNTCFLDINKLIMRKYKKLNFTDNHIENITLTFIFSINNCIKYETSSNYNIEIHDLINAFQEKLHIYLIFADITYEDRYDDRFWFKFCFNIICESSNIKIKIKNYNNFKKNVCEIKKFDIFFFEILGFIKPNIILKKKNILIGFYYHLFYNNLLNSKYSKTKLNDVNYEKFDILKNYADIYVNTNFYIFEENVDYMVAQSNQIILFIREKIKRENLYYLKQIMRKKKTIKDIDNLEELNKINNKKKLTKKDEQRKKLLISLIDRNILYFNSDLYNRNIQKYYAKFINIEYFNKYLNEPFIRDTNIYFTIYFDFRGRFYYYSTVAPDKGWPYRWMYVFNNLIDDKLELKLNKFKNSLNKDILNLEKMYDINLIKQKYNIKSYYELWIIFAIGEKFLNKNKEKINLDEIISNGLVAIKEKKYKNSDDILENSELNYYYLALNIKNKNIYISKDISASILQNASVILGIKNKKSLEILNIHNYEYHDPYYPLIRAILKLNNINNIKKFINRKTFKKVIMTRYYKAKINTCFNYFLDELEIKDRRFVKKNYNIIWQEFKIIYNEIENLEKNILFKYSILNYDLYLKQNNILDVEYDDFKCDLIYYKLKQQRLEIYSKFLKKRISITYKELNLNQVDEMKTNTAKIANIFHSFDSRHARLIVTNFQFNIFCVHDAFFIEPENIIYVIILANKVFDINYKNKSFINDINYDDNIYNSLYKIL